MVQKVFFLFLFFAAGCAALAHAQNVPAIATTATIKGSVAVIDWVAGKVIVRTYDFNNELDEITFYVTRDTTLTKRGGTIYLSDLQQSDSVRVVYESSAMSFAGLKAISITVTN